MSHLTRNLLKAIDYEKARKQRNENYQVLDTLLGTENPGPAVPLAPAPFQAPDGPLAYPFYSPNGIALRKALAKEKIYVPTYWGNVISSCPEDSVEYQCAANILALPCDHRYGRPEMEQIARAVTELTAAGRQKGAFL